MVSKMVYGPVLRAVRLMKFLSVRNGAPDARTESEPQKNKKKGGPLPKVYKRASPQAHKLSSLTMKQYPLLWDFIRLNRKG
jgi:hypothetical protein